MICLFQIIHMLLVASGLPMLPACCSRLIAPDLLLPACCSRLAYAPGLPVLPACLCSRLACALGLSVLSACCSGHAAWFRLSAYDCFKFNDPDTIKIAIRSWCNCILDSFEVFSRQAGALQYLSHVSAELACLNHLSPWNPDSGRRLFLWFSGSFAIVELPCFHTMPALD